MSAYFREPRLKAALTFQDVYMGLSSFEAPATFSMMPHTEIAPGVWFPRGGMYRVVEALMEIASEAGVEFIFEAAVERIEVDGTRARSVVLAGGRRFKADVVVANVDLPYIYQCLLPEQDLAQWLAQKRFFYSVVSFFWGVDKTYPTLAPHTLFLADNYQENFERITQSCGLPDNPCLYIHAPARLDPSLAPKGRIRSLP
jgi:phytoene dehydrogenase-like protein